MHRELLIACSPYLGAIVVSLFAMRWLVLASGTRCDLRRVLRLHRDQAGAVQSLSFVLTVPIFLLFMMFVVQMSQLTIGRIVIEYAAFAAARSAIVWVPANLGAFGEQENRIGTYEYLGDVHDDDGYEYSEYAVTPEGPKYNRIHFAAAMACMTICPSRDVGAPRTHPGNEAAPALIKLFQVHAPTAAANPKIPVRLRNKLAYALEHTRVEILVRHKNSEPALLRYEEPPYPEEFAFNEIGWQDQLLVTVRHDFALLPGPGRVMARPTAGYASRSSGSAAGFSNTSYNRVHAHGRVFVYPLSATVRLNNEGEKPVLPYLQPTPWGAAGDPVYEPPVDGDDSDY